MLVHSGGSSTITPSNYVLDEAADFLRIKTQSRINGKTVIKVQNLKKTYNGVSVVDGISFNVNEGEIFGLLGPNGAGKTTTVEMIEGLRRADSGEISVFDMDNVKNANQIKERVGIQLQIPALLPLLSVEEVLSLFGKVYKHAIPVPQLLKMVTLEESRTVLTKNLSGGQQQRLSVAMALVNDPEIAFLDEPSTGLDPQSRHQLWSVIKDMRNRGKTVILTTHFMEEAERLCDRLIIMDYGKIIATGSPQQLIDTYFKESAIQFETVGRCETDTYKTFPGVTEVLTDNAEVIIYSSNVQETISAALRHMEALGVSGKMKNLHVRQSTLEDVFLKLTGRRIRN